MSSQPLMDVENILPIEDRTCGLRGFVVIHSTARGPATGGIRLYPYPSDEAARSDGYRLARAMTFKAAAADLPVGGGKIVLFDAPELQREAALRSIGRTLESMNGAFLAGRDVGIPVADGAIIRSQTRYMVDESEEGVGDLNLATALGVLAGARAALAFSLGTSSFQGVRVALQGAGGVGRWLAAHLAEEGAVLTVCDTNRAALETLRETTPFEEVSPEAIYDVDCELFAPCAIGGVIDPGTAKRLIARVVAGSANNVLSEPEAGALMMARGITYAPDYLVNAGALIQGVRFLLEGERRSPEAIQAIGAKTAELLERAMDRKVPPEALLERDTRERLKLLPGPTDSII